MKNIICLQTDLRGRIAAVAVGALVFLHPAMALEGKIIAVSDGDTITLLDRNHIHHKIRLQGIDAPEKHQAFGSRSGQHLSKLAFGKEAVAECRKRDRYGREVCKVLIAGTDINLAQVQSGMAWWYREYAREQSSEDRRAYEESEGNARHQRLGLWADSAPVPPWEWRRAKRAGTN